MLSHTLYFSIRSPCGNAQVGGACHAIQDRSAV